MRCRWCAWSIVVVATVVGVAIFARGSREIVRTVRIGRPGSGRWTPVGPRLATLTREVLGHGRFQHRPVVKVAHWVVMVSFALLFLTLVTGYGQVVDPSFALPLIGHFPPLEWAIEAIAWASLVGILALITLRVRLGRRSGARGSSGRTRRRRSSSRPPCSPSCCA